MKPLQGLKDRRAREKEKQIVIINGNEEIPIGFEKPSLKYMKISKEWA
ncbi:MAG: hypothetical protein ACOX1X_02410 [Dethiobacteria bacterium]